MNLITIEPYIAELKKTLETLRKDSTITSYNIKGKPRMIKQDGELRPIIAIRVDIQRDIGDEHEKQGFEVQPFWKYVKMLNVGLKILAKDNELFTHKPTKK